MSGTFLLKEQGQHNPAPWDARYGPPWAACSIMCSTEGMGGARCSRQGKKVPDTLFPSRLKSATLLSTAPVSHLLVAVSGGLTG